MTSARDLPEPLGFPRCARCAYVKNGSAQSCATCASKTLQPLSEAHCPICSQTIDSAGDTCRNTLCRWSPAIRYFTRVDAIALFSGPLEQTLKTFKYIPKNQGWAWIFGRLIIGWLDAHEQDVDDIDLIIGNPTASGRTPLQHIEAMMDAAHYENTTGRWPLAEPGAPVLIKTRETPKSAGNNWQAKMTAAREHAAALQLCGSVEGKRILLVDDVFTTGAQMHTVAKYLMTTGGASEVRGLVLARASW